MKLKITLFCLFITASFLTTKAQTQKNQYDSYFNEAYTAYPDVPKGVLEAVAYVSTHITHFTHADNETTCSGIPFTYGVMGLTLDGKNYFRNNLNLISALSGYDIQQIIKNPQTNILAYAKAYSIIKQNLNINTQTIEDQIPVLIELSELPKGEEDQKYAIDTHLYSVLEFLNNFENQSLYSLPNYKINFDAVFGAENFKVLSSTHVIITKKNSTITINDIEGNAYKNNSVNSIMSPDYGPAIWNPTTCNYSSRSSAISAVAIHDTEGNYAGAISWFKNCSAQVSAHYVLRSSDGQITQMVLESNKAWHIGSENGYTIGLEHEGFATQTGWYTTAMYNTSAALVKDICLSGYGINPTTCYNGPSSSGTNLLSSTIKIKGHQHYPNQTHTDPGINWNWPLYYCLINTCSSGPVVPTNLAVTPPTCTNNNATFTWANGTNVTKIEVSNPLGGWYQKNITGNTTTAPAGFTVSFTFLPGQTYSWRLYNGSVWTNGPSFTVPNCPPTNLAVVVPTCTDHNAYFSWQNHAPSVTKIEVSNPLGGWYQKTITSGTTATGPAGFTPAFTFQAGTVYNWRLYNGVTYTSGPSFTVVNCAPKGNLDVGNCYTVSGWAFDPDVPSATISVNIYIDGTFVTALPTSQLRTDVNATYTITGNHGFNWSMPSTYRNGVTHTVQVTAVNNPTGTNPVITNGTYQTGVCNKDPLGYLDSATCNYISGWSYDPNSSSQSDSVAVYIDGVYYPVGSSGLLPCNMPRLDVNAAYSITGNHGFSLPTPNQFKDGSTHSLSLYMVNIPHTTVYNPAIKAGIPTGINTGTVNFGPCAAVTAILKENILNGSIDIFPNPFSDELTLSINPSISGAVTIKLIDVLGKEIIVYKNDNYNATQNKLVFNTANLKMAVGVYLLTLTTPQGTSVKKIVKQ